MPEDMVLSLLAERAGFEPAIRLPAYTLSKRAPSATRTPLQTGHPINKLIKFQTDFILR